MIISHKHQYLFVELPHTASTAIGQELCQYYDGVQILHKHAHYFEFLRVANLKEKSYFTFAGIRDPLDVVVTLYFKVKTNHQNFFTDPIYWQKNGGHVTNKELRWFRFIKASGADFATYFKRFYKIPYDSYGYPSPEDFDFTIRYERLQLDFAKVVALFGADLVRPLPVVNKTEERDDDFWSYYTPDTYRQVVRVFGPYLKLWSYQLPSDWGSFRVPRLAQLQFDALRLAKKARIKVLWTMNRNNSAATEERL